MTTDWQRVCVYLRLQLEAEEIGVHDDIGNQAECEPIAYRWADQVAQMPQAFEVMERLLAVANDPGQIRIRPHPAMDAAGLIRLALRRCGRRMDLSHLPGFARFCDPRGDRWGIRAIFPREPGDRGLYTFVCETGEQRELDVSQPVDARELTDADRCAFLEMATMTHAGTSRHQTHA